MTFIKPFAIKVSHPLSDFYVFKIKARDLLKISFSEELEYIDESGRLRGSQRKVDERRLKEIAKYIDSVEMTFPNSIILSANYTPEGEVLDISSPTRWEAVEESPNVVRINIPTDEPLAAIIDGQHRLKAFRFVEKPERLDLEILCSVFFDLPNSYQAFLFATINGNQKKVDKSLALEQFGFNVEDEPQKSWTPEKLAVYLSRKLNINKTSPFHGHIKVAPKDENRLIKGLENDWLISTATIVEGILSLISLKPKRDRVEMGQQPIFGGRTRKMLKEFTDTSPLRELYLNNEDDSIYNIVFEYFNACKSILFDKPGNSYINKTIGIQALFDLLKSILKKEGVKQSYVFGNYLIPVENVDFQDNYFQSSNVGRIRIKNLLLFANGIVEGINFKDEDILEFKRLLPKS